MRFSLPWSGSWPGPGAPEGAAGLPDGGLNALEIRPGEPFLQDRRAGQAQDLRRAHHREVVDRAADREAPDVSARKEDRVHHVGVGRKDDPLVPQSDRGAVVHGREADPFRHRIFHESLEKDLLDQGAHGAAPRALLQRDPLDPVFQHERAHQTPPRSGCPPYWCQILQVPSEETMQAPTGLSGTHSLPKSVQSEGDAIPDMMSPQMQLATSVGGP